MIRLTILTLIGLFAVLALFGRADPDHPFNPPTEETSEATPAPETSSEAIEAATDLAQQVAVPAVSADQVQQTPEQVQRFPGPALRPSPEYAGQAEAAQTEQLAASGAQILYVTGNRVNFRAGPSTNDRVIGALQSGSPVEVLGETTGGWVQLRDTQGRQGYMSGDFLSPDRPN
ncbi:SH3 domain-containing protein [Paracoccus sp. M683]|uniref:SH3 domain-containing protein n=1 Tax=Paracoccus sp. M683 TaxID=2594268 RepID=UPI00163D7203|nr:SH3 domain-containing protein [Paracoccus sp. M683]